MKYLADQALSLLLLHLALANARRAIARAAMHNERAARLVQS